jgi:hypothetical protein
VPTLLGKWYSPSWIANKYGQDALQKAYLGIWPEALVQEANQIIAGKNMAEAQQKGEEVPTTILDAREGFKFGCDPELFVFNTERNEPVPAGEVGIIGTKDKPEPLFDKGEIIGWSQVDGMAAEFNIPPVSTFKDFNRHIEGTLKALGALLHEGHELRAVPAVTFSEEVFDAAPDKAKELGCSPDYNAWTGKINPPPKDAANPFLRTASGHLHIGWTEGADISDNQHVMNCRDVVKQFDWYLGGWSLKLDPDPVRRRLYGEAGAMRFKSYGVEYRVLSNFWVTSRDRRLVVWNRMQQAINDIAKAFIPDKAKAWNDILRHSINDGKLDPTLAASYRFPLVSLNLM